MVDLSLKLPRRKKNISLTFKQSCVNAVFVAVCLSSFDSEDH